MAADLKRAEEREIEFLDAKSKRKFEKRKTSGNKHLDKIKHGNEAVRELSEAEALQEEERAHEYVREELKKRDPSNQNQLEGINTEAAQAIADIMALDENDDGITKLTPGSYGESAEVITFEKIYGIPSSDNSDEDVVENAELDEDGEDNEATKPSEVTETAEGVIGFEPTEHSESVESSDAPEALESSEAKTDDQ
jgi:hypothetical protein